MEPIVNRVAQSEIEVFDLSQFLPAREPASVDLSSFLDRGLLLREKPFRRAVAEHDWSAYQDSPVGIHCSTNALVPVWAYMLVASKLDGIADPVVHGSSKEAGRVHFARALAAFDWERYANGIVVVKGCGTGDVPDSAYVDAMTSLLRVARKVMFGEPCSSVPLWRRAKPATTPG